MTPEQVIGFFEQRPFEPFTMCLADGRELHVQHPEIANLGRFGSIVYFVHPTRQIEVVDSALIASLRTVYAADLQDWIGKPHDS